MRALVLLFTLAASAAFIAEAETPRYPITQAIVATFLRAQGLNVMSSQVQLPMNLTSATPDPSLEIAATQTLSRGALRLEIRCSTAGECLAFDALVTVEDEKTPPGTVNTQQSSRQSAAERSLTIATYKSAHQESSSDLSLAHVRVGSEVLLVIEDRQMQIHLPAIAMDSGSMGDMVRVRTLDRKKIFRGVVAESGHVREVIQ